MIAGSTLWLCWNCSCGLKNWTGPDLYYLIVGNNPKSYINYVFMCILYEM